MAGKPSKVLSLTYTNFQKHKKTKITLSPTVTTIVGPTDAGKTSLFRGARWVVFNRPKGKSFVRRGAKKACSVSIVTTEGKITRKKTARSNLYFVNGERLSAVKTDVPKLVFDLLKLGQANFQNQLDGPYWFNLPPGQAAKAINKLTDLSLLDRMQEGAKKLLTTKKTKLETLTEQLADAKEDKKKLAWIVPCRKEWKEVETLYAEYEQLDEDYKELEGMIPALKRAKKRTVGPMKDFLPVLKAREEADKIAAEYQELQLLINDYKDKLALWDRKKIELSKAKKSLTQNGKVCPTCLRPLPSPSQSPTSTLPESRRRTESATGPF